MDQTSQPTLDLAWAETPTPALLRAAYALTHRIHEAHALRDEHFYTRSGRLHEQNERDLRAQRDLIDTEVLRRAGEATNRSL